MFWSFKKNAGLPVQKKYSGLASEMTKNGASIATSYELSFLSIQLTNLSKRKNEQ